MLAAGTKAPQFNLIDQDGTAHSLEEQNGTWTLIYFYPKDDTLGCTKEACAIRDVYNDFSRMGVTVFGVSKDNQRSHKKFATKYELPFTLLSDETTHMMRDYEAWGEKKMMGKTFEGTLRVSYLLSPDLTIAKVYPEVDPANHALEILKDLKELTAV